MSKLCDYTPKLDGANYLAWTPAMDRALGTKNKFQPNNLLKRSFTSSLPNHSSCQNNVLMLFLIFLVNYLAPHQLTTNFLSNIFLYKFAVNTFHSNFN